tara:strand:+ start:80 stop:319 length:240 start_codon:yes stop_codon:yes gene_type:complete
MKKIIDEIYEDDFCKSLSEKLTEEEKKIVSKEVENIVNEVQRIVDTFSEAMNNSKNKEIFAKSMESILSKGAEFWQQKK